MSARGFRASKCFEGSGPLVIWSVAAPGADGQTRKFHLVADATQRGFGVRVEASRTDDVKPGGAVVALLRKHARTGGIGRIFRDPATGSIWLPLFGGPGTGPAYWVQLAWASPPELRFIDAAGQALVRKSSQGTYTKRRPVGEPLPAYPPAATMEDLTDGLLAAAMELVPARGAAGLPAAGDASDNAGDNSAHSAATATVAAGTAPPFAEPGAPAPLPEYQRLARDRLARRLKTVRKALEKLGRQATGTPEAAALKRQAAALAVHLHDLPPGAWEVKLTGEDGAEVVLTLDPELSPGQNLEALYARIKKARRATVAQAEQSGTTAADLAALTRDLDHLRAAPLPLAEVARILTRHHLPLERPQGPTGASTASTPWRTYDWRPTGAAPTAKPVTILVGRSAAASDELCRQAKSNDFWLHAAGTTGSHVIIPARQVPGGAPDQALLRAAAMLALHNSRMKDDRAGEVYVSRRQHIKKRKGMAPGLWQVDKAETLYIRYEDRELQDVLALVQP